MLSRSFLFPLLLSAASVLACATLADHERVATGYSGIVLSNFKSPVVWRGAAAGYGSPFSSDAYSALAARTPVDCRFSRPTADEEDVDVFPEFGCGPGAEDTLVVVALSGGGSRAGLLAAYTLDLLERKYAEICAAQNSRVPSSCPEASLARTIDAFSTVSGGSLYAYYVLRQSEAEPTRAPPDLFQHTRAERESGIRNLGRWVFWSYFGGNLFGRPIPGLWPISWIKDVFTDLTYRDYLIRGLEFGGFPRAFGFVAPAPHVYFRDAAEWTVQQGLPRFYFNATSVKTATPFVLTQRITNLQPEDVPLRSARLDLPVPACHPDDLGTPICEPARRRPLRHSSTLEDVGNSPGAMAASHAAIASAAFPFAVDPVILRRYAQERDGKVSPADALVRLADGGVFDNSGLTTAADLFEYLQTFRQVKHLVLIAVNADAERYDAETGPLKLASGAPSWIKIGVPWPTLASGPDAINLIHYTNKRRAEQLAWRQIENAVQRTCEADAKRAPGHVDCRSAVADRVHYFPVDVSQLADRDPEKVSGGAAFYATAAPLPTTFWTRDADARVLDETATKIVTTHQKRRWPVGRCGKGIGRLDEAVAYALIRASSPQWEALDCP